MTREEQQNKPMLEELLAGGYRFPFFANARLPRPTNKQAEGITARKSAGSVKVRFRGWCRQLCLPSARAQGTVGFVKFDIKDINSAACADPPKRIKEVAQVAMMGFREVLIAGGYVNKVTHAYFGLKVARLRISRTEATAARGWKVCSSYSRHAPKRGCHTRHLCCDKTMNPPCTPLGCRIRARYVHPNIPQLHVRK